MPKKKKVKKAKKVKLLNKVKSPLKTSDRKSTIPGPDEKPEIKKVKKQPTEKKVYNLKDLRRKILLYHHLQLKSDQLLFL